MPQALPSAAAIPRRHLAPPPTPPQRTAQVRADVKKLLPIVAVFYSFLLLPPEVQVSALGLNFPAYRIALLLLILPVGWSAMRGPKIPLGGMDAAIAIIGFWTMLSFMVIYGFEQGLVRGASITIDTVLPYIIARVSISSLDDLRYMLILVLPGLALAGASLVVESLSGRLLVRPAFAAIFGNLKTFDGGEVVGNLVLEAEFRLGGLMRAFGPFPHPILAGMIMIGFLPLYYFSGLRSWVFIGGIAATLTGFFGLSSAAFLALFLSIGAIAVYHVKAYVPKISWWSISTLFFVMLWTLHIVSKNGLLSIVSRLTLSPGTADYRLHIWEWGWINVEKNPWFGLGYRPWERLDWMGESVDAHFLLLAMRHGLLVPIVLLIAIIFTVVRLGLAIPYLSPRDRAFAIGINICIVNYVLVGQTVNYFGSALIVFMAFLGMLAGVGGWADEHKNRAYRQQVIEQMRRSRLRANLPSPV